MHTHGSAHAGVPAPLPGADPSGPAEQFTEVGWAVDPGRPSNRGSRHIAIWVSDEDVGERRTTRKWPAAFLVEEGGEGMEGVQIQLRCRVVPLSPWIHALGLTI